jgi:hypothetical protein
MVRRLRNTGRHIVMKRAIGLAAVLLVVVSSFAFAQWRGLGRAQGQVVDESGAAVADATVRADLLGQGGTTVKSNEKGEWVVSGIAQGEWKITVAKEGMATATAKVVVKEMAAVAPVKVTLKKAAQ